MTRAYIVYLVMFVALIGGMTLVMTMGESVRAPDDLSGEWVVEWDNAPPPESGEPTLHIAQSGRFFVVTFGERPPMSMKLQDGWTGKSKGRRLAMTLAARPLWRLHLHGEIPPENRWQVPELNLELVGPTRHIGIARRVRPETAEDKPVPDPSPARARVRDAVPADAAEPVELSLSSPTTRPAPSASVPSETAHAR